MIARDPDAPPAFVEIASTPPDDLSALRHALYPLCDDRESPSVVRRLIGLVSQDLESGRRSFDDTITVLSQIRRFLKHEPAFDEELKALLIDVWRGRHNLGGHGPWPKPACANGSSGQRGPSHHDRLITPWRPNIMSAEDSE